MPARPRPQEALPAAAPPRSRGACRGAARGRAMGVGSSRRAVATGAPEPADGLVDLAAAPALVAPAAVTEVAVAAPSAACLEAAAAAPSAARLDAAPHAAARAREEEEAGAAAGELPSKRPCRRVAPEAEELLEKRERQERARVSLLAAVDPPEGAPAGWGDMVRTITGALQQAKDAELGDACDEVRAAKARRAEHVKAWLRAAVGEGRESVLNAVLLYARTAELDVDCPEMLAAREAGAVAGQLPSKRPCR